MEDQVYNIVNKIRLNEIVLWAGSGFSLYAGMPSSKDLIRAIINEAAPNEQEILKNKPQSLPEIAEEFYQMRNCSKSDLIKIIKNKVDINPKNILVHMALTKIPQIKTIITTNYDTLFEKAYGSNILPIVSNQVIPFANSQEKIKLYKIHGDFSYTDNIILTKSDYINFFKDKQYEPIWNNIRTIIGGSSILFIGYSIEDENIEFIFDNISKCLGNYQKECYLVCPNLPSYKQNYLSCKHIQYIDMSGEEFIYEVQREIEKYLLKDCIAGYIEPKIAAKILKEKGIDVEFKITGSGNTILSNISSKENTHIQGSITFSKDFTMNKKVKDILEGKTIGSVSIPKGEILEVSSEFKGIIIPMLEEVKDMGEIEWKVKTVPNKTFTTDFILKNSQDIIQNIKGEIYNSKYIFQVNFNHTDFHIIIKSNKQTVRTNIDLQYGLSKNVVTGMQLYDFLYKWLNGEEIMAFTNIEGKILNIPVPLDNEIVKRNIKSREDLYKTLFEIENYYKICIEVPDKINQEELDNICEIYNFIKNIKIKCENLQTNIVNYRKDTILTILTDNKPVSIKMVSGKDKVIDLFGKKFNIGNLCVETLDAVIENKEQVKKDIAMNKQIISITLNSKSDEMYYYHSKSESIKNCLVQNKIL